MQRYFANIINNKVFLSDGDIHHVLHVMRCKIDDEIEVVFDNKLYVSRIKSINPLLIDVSYEVPLNTELPNELTLFFSLAKGDKIEFVLQKATELGATKIVLLKTKRCVVKMDKEDFERKLPRYSKIVKEAAEQSHRLRIPSIIGIVDIDKIPNDLLMDKNYIAYEKEAGSTDISFNDVSSSTSVSILIGSEGGLEENEVKTLEQQGFKRASLGKRILRCETAAVYALSVISYLMEK